MKIACPKCRANYEVALPPLGEAGIELKCAVCHHPFRIKKKTSKPAPSQRATGAAPGTSVPAKLPEHPPMDDVSASLPQGMQSLDDSAGDAPDPFDFDDESLDLDLPDEVTAAGSMELRDLPETKDWDEVADSAKALEDQELEEAAQHAEEFANGATAPETETSAEPEKNTAEGADGVVDPEIWMDAFSDEPTLDATGGTHPDAQEEPFEDPEMWAEAFADQAAHTPEPDTGEPAVELEPQDDEAMIDPADAWAEMFAEETPEDTLWDKAVAENEIVPEPAAQEETPADPPQPQEVPPGEPEEVPRTGKAPRRRPKKCRPSIGGAAATERGRGRKIDERPGVGA
ncbi:zinc-ribbon domain-containing protein [Nitrospina watsonii]|uniref:Znf/thioredoxin_put domain-containing protein n=1 Tax=Nitrospina watsonii TaxID=1323948 RepID=A0ABM9HC33_9BACT|nr:zinc-ribbon domain-containing protein [Nitrospina watsonii]CAI2717641.1 Znf/thioredoxin_put domain-containing protein [Nitrospina watsonii]